MRTDVSRSPGRAAQWLHYRERGSVWLLRFMTYLSLRFGRRASRILLYLIAVYFFLFAPTAARHARDYLRRALGRTPTPADRFRQLVSFASTIHDRVFLINRRLDLFDISVEGEPLVQNILRRGQGAFLLSAHLGCVEVVSSLARRRGGPRIAMAMYADNARKINTMLSAIHPGGQPEIIALGHIEAMLKLRQRLDEGVFVGMMGDRTLGDEPVRSIPLLGAPAAFPTGPMRVAAMLRRPVIFMLGLYRGGNRYHVVFELLADFSETTGDRSTAVADAMARYAALLERYCRSDPYNWFNFFDFWQEGRRDSSSTSR